MKTKFLLADDDPDDGSLFCEAVQEVGAGMECRIVENGRKLLDLLSGTDGYSPDIIFLDINMPLMNGWECLKALKQDPQYAGIKIIMYSTSALSKDVDRAYDLGADLFITKPEDFDELRQILKIIALDSPASSLSSLRKFTSVKVR